MDVVGTVGALSSALKIVKDLKEIDVEFDKAALRLKVAELTSALADAKLGLVEISEQMADRQKTIDKLTAALKFRDEQTIEFRGYLYRSKDGQPRGYPMCSPCAANGEFVQTTSLVGQGLTCPRCKARFGRVAIFSDEDVPSQTTASASRSPEISPEAP